MNIIAKIAALKMFYLVYFLGLVLIGLPIVYVLLLAPGLDLAQNGQWAFFPMLLQRLWNGVDSFALMALPFFVLAGELMSAGGVTVRIVTFAESLIGHFRGGLGHVCVLASVMLSGGSGSAVADASALGGMLIPAMQKMKYPDGISAAIIASAGILAPIIPPSGLMIMYAFVENCSVAAMFAGGIIPGLMIAGSLMLVIGLRARSGVFPDPKPRASWAERGQAAKKAILPLGTPVILMGGILGGIMTATEAAAIAAFYALLLGVFYTREIKPSQLPRIFANSAISSAKILILVGAAVAFASVVSLRHTPQMLGSALVAITDNPHLLFLLVNITLLGVGCIMDAGPTILILGPILAPAMQQVGIDPIHFGVVMVVNLTIGLITPPMGLVLFVTQGISGVSLDKLVKEMLPFFGVLAVVLCIISNFPETVLFLPKAWGLM